MADVNEQSSMKRADVEDDNEGEQLQLHTREKSDLFKAKELTRAQNRCKEIMQRYM